MSDQPVVGPMLSREVVALYSIRGKVAWSRTRTLWTNSLRDTTRLTLW